MIWTIYFIILAYFTLGFTGFYIINRKKKRDEARNSWVKFITYFFIIHILFFSILFFPVVFRILTLIIITGGFYELYKIFRESGYRKPVFFLSSLFILGLFSIGFYFFSGLSSRLVLFTFLILSIFDSFSQITGQLWGRRKLFRKISPQKTVEGLIGGIIVAVASSWLLRNIIEGSDLNPIRLATGIVAFAFVGDMITSFYKRSYNVKDFSTLIPGHGGFLDRFDSLIAGGSYVAISELISRL